MAYPASQPLLGVMGGTFDPIHYGHLRLAEEARQALGLSGVRLVPAGQPPHRERPGTSPEDRLALARLAVTGVPHFEVDAAEVLAQQPSYTVLTLLRLRQELGAKRPIVLLLGMDAFLGLPTWYRWQELSRLAHIGVATRPGYVLDKAAMPAALAAELHERQAPVDALGTRASGLITEFGLTPLAISATAIRSQLRSGRSPRFLLPDAVLEYIWIHHLYES